MAGASFREVRLRQYVLNSSDRADLTFVIDVLQLVHLVWLIDYAVTLFKVDQLVIRSCIRHSRLGLLSCHGGLLVQ